MKRLIFALSLLLMGFSTIAQQIHFTARAERVVELNEPFQLIFEVNGQGTNFKAPDLKEFAYQGPSTSTSMSTSIVNGKMSSEYSQSFVYVLQAKKIGKFTIAPATVTVNGKSVQSNTLVIEVIKGNAGAQANQGQGNQAGNGNTDDDSKANVSNKDLFLSISLNKTSVYQGEPIIASIKVYSRMDISGFQNVKFPPFTGFWAQEIPNTQQVNLQQEVVNGKRYQTGVLKQYVLFPQKSGPITIEPAELECIVLKNSGMTDFFGRQLRSEAVAKVASERKTINIKTLPSNAPAGFKGAVGKFEMTATFDKQNTKADEAINLKIKISGSGNLKIAEPEDIKLPPDFDKYDPKIEEKITNTTSGSSGYKIYDYLIIPRHDGTYKIPPIKFSYFDLGTNSYKTITSKEFEIAVSKGSGNASYNSSMNYADKQDVKNMGSDIRFIKTNNFRLKEKGKLFFGSNLMWLSYIISLVIAILVFIVRRKQIEFYSNKTLVRNKQANKVSRTRLKTAAMHLKNNKTAEFHTEVLKAIWGYLADKFAIPASDLSRERSNEVLSSHGIDQETINELLEIIDNCEFARYAPSSEAGEMGKIFNQATELITKLENKLK